MDIPSRWALAWAGSRIHLIKLLRALGTILQHGAHGGVAVDVGVFTLDIVVLGGLERQILVYFHQTGIHFAVTGAVGAVKDIFLRRAGMAAFDQHALYHVLDNAPRWVLKFPLPFRYSPPLAWPVPPQPPVVAADGLGRPVNGGGDFLNLKGTSLPSLLIIASIMVFRLLLNTFHTISCV